MGKIYFSDHFNVSQDILDEYGAFNISLVTDLPLFIDPFLLFNSEKNEYQQLHNEMIRYLRLLRDKSVAGGINEGLLKEWYTFPEVKQNSLGFCVSGNKGRGLGIDFARSLNRNLNLVFNDFGEERITEGSHLEKLCLIKSGIGKDNISDFTTNLIKEYLLEYTQDFGRKYIVRKNRKKVTVPKVIFNYKTETWKSHEFELPFVDDDYVILTPKDMLTRDDTWINRTDLIKDYNTISQAVDNDQLRGRINNYLLQVLGNKASKKQQREAIVKVLEKYPVLLEYYIRWKEHQGCEAQSISEQNVWESECVFIKQTRDLIKELKEFTGFYKIRGDTFNEAIARVEFLKDVIENKGGHRIFYVDGKPIKRESDLHIMFRLTWIGTPSDVSREVNDGRGPADFKISRGAFDKSLVEFKLASNPKLKRNLDKQIAVYEKASDATKSIKVIVYFNEEELDRVEAILKDLRMEDDKNIILIDARTDNKPSGSKA